jgi:hypothetical protein
LSYIAEIITEVEEVEERQLVHFQPSKRRKTGGVKGKGRMSAAQEAAAARKDAMDKRIANTLAEEKISLTLTTKRRLTQAKSTVAQYDKCKAHWMVRFETVEDAQLSFNCMVTHF